MAQNGTMLEGCIEQTISGSVQLRIASAQRHCRMEEHSQTCRSETKKDLDSFSQSVIPDNESSIQEHVISSLMMRAGEGSISDGDTECHVTVKVENEDDTMRRDSCDREYLPPADSVVASSLASTSAADSQHTEMHIASTSYDTDSDETGEDPQNLLKEYWNWKVSYMDYEMSSEDEGSRSEAKSDPDYSKSGEEEMDEAESEDSDYSPRKHKYKSKWPLRKRYSRNTRVNQQVHSKLRERLLCRVTGTGECGDAGADMWSIANQATFLDKAEHDFVIKNRYLCLKNSLKAENNSNLLKANQGWTMYVLDSEKNLLPQSKVKHPDMTVPVCKQFSGESLEEQVPDTACLGSMDCASQLLQCLSENVNLSEEKDQKNKSRGAVADKEQIEILSGRSLLLQQQLMQQELQKKQQQQDMSALSIPTEHAPSSGSSPAGFTLLRSLLTPPNNCSESKVKNTLLSAMLQKVNTGGKDHNQAQEGRQLRPSTKGYKICRTIRYTDEDDSDDDPEIADSVEEELEVHEPFAVYLNNAESELEESGNCSEEVNLCRSSYNACVSICESSSPVKIKSEPVSPEIYVNPEEGSGNLSLEHVEIKSENASMMQSDAPVPKDQTRQVVVKKEPVASESNVCKIRAQNQKSGVQVENSHFSTLKTLLCGEGTKKLVSNSHPNKKVCSQQNKKLLHTSDHSKTSETRHSKASDWGIHPGSNERKYNLRVRKQKLVEPTVARDDSPTSSGESNNILKAALPNSSRVGNRGYESTGSSSREADREAERNANVSTTSCSQWLLKIAKSVGLPQGGPQEEKVTLLKSMLTGDNAQDFQASRIVDGISNASTKDNDHQPDVISPSLSRSGNIGVGSNNSASGYAIRPRSKTFIENKDSKTKKLYDSSLSSSKILTSSTQRNMCQMTTRRSMNVSQGGHSEASSSGFNSLTGCPFQCRLCGKVFQSVSLLQEHMNHHFPTMPFGCNMCPESFMSGEELEQHGAMHLKELSPALVFKCTVCGDVFDTEAEHNQHRLAHETSVKMQYMYNCSQCDNIFSSPRLLDVHVKTHASKQCAVCGVHLKSSILLDSHMKTHVRIHTCNYCKKEFMSKKGFEEHQAKCKNVHCNTFSCSSCLTRFATKKNLVDHILRFHCQRAQECESCSMIFCYKLELANHREECHLQVDQQNLRESVPDRKNDYLSGHLGETDSKDNDSSDDEVGMSSRGTRGDNYTDCNCLDKMHSSLIIKQEPVE